MQEKSSGITPGYRVVDPSGRLYQIKFDPPANPEMGSAVELIGAAIYHALGYNVVQGYIVEVDPAAIVISPEGDDRGHDAAAGGSCGATTSIASSRAPPGRRTASTARSPAVSPRAARSATSSTTARGPTIRTTSTRTSIGASCAAAACSRPG